MRGQKVCLRSFGKGPAWGTVAVGGRLGSEAYQGRSREIGSGPVAAILRNEHVTCHRRMEFETTCDRLSCLPACKFFA